MGAVKFYKIGLVDAFFEGNAAVGQPVAQPTVDPISITAAQSLDAQGPADRFIHRARGIDRLQYRVLDDRNVQLEAARRLGCVNGLGSAAADEKLLPDEVEILGLITRTEREPGGGGLPSKVIAHERIIGAWGDTADNEIVKWAQSMLLDLIGHKINCLRKLGMEWR